MIRRLPVVVLYFLILTAFVAAGQVGIWAHKDPVEMDTVAYLQKAIEISKTGGIVNHIPNCLSGVYKEATQHPLYLLFLSLFSEENVHFFVRAKVATLWIGFAGLCVFLWCLRAFFGDATALTAGCLTVLSATFIGLSTMVACEPLLALFFLLFWYATARGMEDPKYWGWAGLWAGLSFLSKSLGILTIPIFLICAAAHLVSLRKGRRRVLKYAAVFFAAFLLVTWPLFWRNVKVYGTPFYSDSSSVMWLDRWHDYLRTDIHEDPPSAGEYFRTHTSAQVADTLIKGLVDRDRRMFIDGLKPLAFWKRPLEIQTLQGYHEVTVPWQGVWAAALGIFFAISVIRRSRSPETLVSVVSVAVFSLFVAWYSKVFSSTPPTRLLYPILFLVLAQAAAGIVIVFKRKAYWAAAAFLVVYLASLHMNFNWKEYSPEKAFRFNPIAATQMEWVRAHTAPGDKILVNSVFSGTAFYFRKALAVEWLEWPALKDMREVEEFVRSSSAKYAFLDLSTVAYNKAFEPYFGLNPRVGLIPKKPLPAFFKPIRRPPGIPPAFEIYSFDA